ncbi:MAG: Arc family DNA-binding protein [Xanthomonadales bacterium]|nr:Arc family DNA-binding protein [Xanthomonadales bacterium]
MAVRKPFALRIPEDILEAMRRWSDDELRSLNAQIEYVLRDGLRRAGRLPREDRRAAPGHDTPS